MKLSAATVSVLVIAVFTTFDEGQSSVASGLTMFNSVLDGAAKLTDVIKLLDDKFLKPITEKINREIRKIDTDIDGLGVDEKQLVFDAKLQLERGRSEIKATRTVLMILAQTTITRSQQMLRIIRRLSQGGFLPAKEKQGVVLVVTKMRQLIERSELILDEATQLYNQVQASLEEVQRKLASFTFSVTALADKAQATFDEDKSFIQKLTYITFTVFVGPIWGPIAAHFSSEADIASWKVKLDELLQKCSESKANSDEMIDKIKQNLKDIRTEKQIIRNWQESVALVFDDFKSGDYLTLIEWDNVGPIQNLEDLIKVCEKYIKHANLASSRL